MNATESAPISTGPGPWLLIRPPLALVAAAFLGLAGAVLLATVIRPLLQVIVSLVATIASAINRSSPDLSADAISTVDLGFGVLGGAILLATIKDTLVELKAVLTKWATVSDETLLSAAIAIFLSFLALGLSVYGLANAKQSNEHGVALATHPMFLTSSESVGYMPIYFENATLKEAFWDDAYLRDNDRVSVPVASDIWAGGTNLSPNDRMTISFFLEELRRCASRASPTNSIELRVTGYASTREFRHERKGEHPQSVQLNIQAANDRARAVHEVVAKQQDASLKLVPLAPYSTLAQMHDARMSIDRLPGHELLKQEDLARRADITIIAAPGCKGVAQLASSQ